MHKSASPWLVRNPKGAMDQSLAPGEANTRSTVHDEQFVKYFTRNRFQVLCVGLESSLMTGQMTVERLVAPGGARPAARQRVSDYRWRARVAGGVSVGVSLAAEWPELFEAAPAEERELAEQTLLSPVLSARDVDLAELISTQTPRAFAFMIIDGLVFKESRLADRSALELLGPDDLFAPPPTAVRQLASRSASRYLARGRVSMIALGDQFRQAALRWPGISDVLHERLGRQTHRASMHLAILHLPRLEDRVLALFADLAERFGRISPHGIVIDLPLTHELIGRMVGGRRPTVTLALQRLASDGLLQRPDGGCWYLDRSVISI